MADENLFSLPWEFLGSGLLAAWIFRRRLVRQMLFTFSDNPTVSVTASPLKLNLVC
ncbi:MAG: hypothetical protein IPN10_08580 [Saprospiraceae bacterium]|nr:hypothetical protein [Saprospiraceae bacterium]